MTAAVVEHCKYCRRHAKANSDHEQRNLISGEWSRLCKRCATKRLNNPFTGLFENFRRIDAARSSSTGET